MDLIKIAEEAFATGKQHPSFKAGDTVTVAYRIIEGNKERVQLYRGVVIKISGHGDKKRFTVRKMSGTVGVERIFPIESPAIDSIEVNKVGKVRRAKLYYLRALTGKKARIKSIVIILKLFDRYNATYQASLVGPDSDCAKAVQRNELFGRYTNNSLVFCLATIT